MRLGVLTGGGDCPGLNALIRGLVASPLTSRIEAEIRVTVLGHLQRGGSPTAADRLLATRYGCKVLDLIRHGQWAHMVALKGIEIVALSATSKNRRVGPNGELVRNAKGLGICFGDV